MDQCPVAIPEQLLFIWRHHASPAQRLHERSNPKAGDVGQTLAERVIAAELSERSESSIALSLMVGSVGRMVNASSTSRSRWSSQSLP